MGSPHTYQLLLDVTKKHRDEVLNLCQLLGPHVGKVRDEGAQKELREALDRAEEGAGHVARLIEILGEEVGWRK